MSNAVLVVDLLKGFLEPGHNLYHADSRRIIPNVQQLIAQEKAAGSEILFLADNHDPDDLEFQVFPVHCVTGTEETQIIPELTQCRPRQHHPQKTLQRLLQHPLSRPPVAPVPRKAANLRRSHQCMRPAHRIRRPQPRLRRRNLLRLRIRPRPPSPPLGPIPLPNHPGRPSNIAPPPTPPAKHRRPSPPTLMPPKNQQSPPPTTNKSHPPPGEG